MKKHTTPHISIEALKISEKGLFREKPILEKFKRFEYCFVALHPFIRTKNEHSHLVNFTIEKWPNKFDLEQYCEPVIWFEILSESKIRDLKSLDRCLAFESWAYSYGEKDELEKFKIFLNDNPLITTPETDIIPEILENKILKKIQQLGYSSVYTYDDLTEKSDTTDIDILIQNSNGLIHNVRIETTDSKLLIAQDIDQRFFYILSNDNAAIEDCVSEINLEGFYCDKKTPEHWSFIEIDENNRASNIK